MRSNKSNVSYFSRDRTPMSQKSSKSYIRGEKNGNFGGKNYQRLTKKRRSQQSNKFAYSPKNMKHKSYLNTYLDSSYKKKQQNNANYSPGQSPTLNKYRNYQNFEKVLRKSPRAYKNKSFTRPRGSRSPRGINDSPKSPKNLKY